MKGQDFPQVSGSGFGNAFIALLVSRYKASPVSLMSDLGWDYTSVAPLSSSMVDRWGCTVPQVKAPRSGLLCLLRNKVAEMKSDAPWVRCKKISVMHWLKPPMHHLFILPCFQYPLRQCQLGHQLRVRI